MTKERILETATELYSQYGVKSVTMHQIAQQLGISKKTIYNEFSDKEELLDSCLYREVHQLQRMVQKAERQAEDSMESILIISADLFSHFSTYCPAFYKDLRHYPGASEYLTSFFGALRDRFVFLFREGVMEGNFLPDKNYEYIASLFTEQVGRVGEKFQWTILTTLLRGVCTEKGIEKLNHLTLGKNV